MSPRELDPRTLSDHIDRLYRAAWALCGRREDAEDLVQETYVRVLRRPRVLRGDDDLAYLLRYTGEDTLVIGTDYGHNDQSSEVEALRNLEQSGEVTPVQYRKIVDDNPRALFGL